MNPIQKAWLRVLNPVVTLVNDKMAKRSGLVGKFGRFFAFGPRQFGFHPINKLISLWNKVFLQTMGLALHNYSFLRHLNFGGHVGARPFAIMSLFGKVMIFWSMLLFMLPSQFQHEQGTTLDHLSKRGFPVPYNALNDRVSAHYTEINSIYSHSMLALVSSQAGVLQKKWERTDDKTRKMRYARKGYTYVQPHSKVIE